MNRPHSACRSILRDVMASKGADVAVSTALPLVPTPYGVTAYDCPHGTTYYLEPTSEQIAAWAREAAQ